MLQKLQNWFEIQHQEFGESVPGPQYIKDILYNIDYIYNARLVKYIGSGDNGIVYLASDGDIIKFTIDEGEAVLWNRLKSKQLRGITSIKDIARLASSKIGDTLVYMLKAEYAPTPLSPDQIKLIARARKDADIETKEEVHQMRLNNSFSKEKYIERRTLNLVKNFQKISKIDDSFDQIAELIIDLADKHGGYIYDLQPDNFRVNLKNEVVLIDPSVPDLIGDIKHPERLMYEEKLDLALNCRIIGLAGLEPALS